MFDILERLFWALTMTSSAAVLIRLLGTRLWIARPYHAFAIMLVAGLVRDLILWPISFDDHAYARAWEVSLLALLACQIYAAIAAYESVAERNLGNLLAALSACVGVGVLPLVFETASFGGNDQLLRLVILLYRWVDSSLAILLIAAGFFMRRTIAPPHLWILAAYFGTTGVVCLIKNLMPLGEHLTDLCYQGIVSALYVTWLFVLPRGRGKNRRLYVQNNA